MPSTQVKFEAIGVDKTAGTFDQVAGRIDRMATMARRVAGLVGGALVMRKLGSEIGASVNRMGELADQAQKLGVSSSTLEKMAFAFDQAGVGGRELVDNILPKMTKSFTDEKAVKTLESLGVNMNQIKALSPDKQFVEIGKAIAKIPSEAERARVAMDVFGKGYAPLLPLFRQGGDAFSESMQKVMAMAPVTAEASVEAGDRLSDGLNALKSGFTSTFDTVLGEAIGAAEKHFGRLDQALPIMWENVKTFVKFVGIRILDLGDNIAEVWRAMSSDWDKTLKWMLNGIWEWIKAVGTLVAQFGKNIWKWLTSGTWDSSSMADVWKKFVEASKPEFSKLGANITWTNLDPLFQELADRTNKIKEGVDAKDKLATGAAGTEVESVLNAGKKAAEAIKDAQYVDASSYEALRLVLGGKSGAPGSAAGGRGSGASEPNMANQFDRMIQPLRDILSELKSQTRLLNQVGTV